MIEVRNISETYLSPVDLDKVIKTTEFYQPTSDEINSYLEQTPAEVNHYQHQISDGNDEHPGNPNNTDVDNLIRTDHLNSEEKKSNIQLCKIFIDILRIPGQKLTFTSKAKHTIHTHDKIPIHTKTYRYLYIHRMEIQKQIDEMLKTGIIRPSSSP